MKINIITVFKTENSGSFLQAWALKEKLVTMGNNVCFCDYGKSFDSLGSKIISIIKCCLRMRLKRATNILKKTIDFKKCQKQLNITTDKEYPDIFFFGSDTLWNFDDKFFKSKIKFFTGADIQQPCYAYSISAGSTSKDVFVNQYEAIKNIKKFRRIAVRDSHTEYLVSKIYPRENVIRTVDPTLLWNKETYIKYFSTKLPYHQKSLVVYYFGAIPNHLWEALKDFARKRNLKIVNVGLHDEQFDISIVGSPTNFITAFSNAEYIFTNTFHGCVFSAIFNKQFATDGIYKKKIEGFLEEFSLLDRVVSVDGDIERVLTSPINYNYINSIIEEKREYSIAYLEACIREVGNHE